MISYALRIYVDMTLEKLIQTNIIDMKSINFRVFFHENKIQ